MFVNLWFGLVVVLWAGYIVLEGFDFGVGMLMPVLARSEADRGAIMTTIGPVWDGNEVWLLVAGGATFAAFPEWYASLFSGYYLALGLILLALIVRVVGIELRAKVETATARAWCDRATVVGSVVPSVLWGVALANFVRGVPMDSHYVVSASLWSLLNPYALLGGVTSFLLFATHGAHFLALRTTGAVRDRALGTARRLAYAVIPVGVVFLAFTLEHRANAVAIAAAVVMAAGLLAGAWAARLGREGLAFLGTAVTCLFTPVLIFAACWPYAVVGRGTPGLTVSAASSSPTTLHVMTVVAFVMTPIVLAYQAWTYWVFRARITTAPGAAPALPLPSTHPARTA